MMESEKRPTPQQAAPNIPRQSSRIEGNLSNSLPRTEIGTVIGGGNFMPDKPLTKAHWAELTEDSAIDPEVIRERGYVSVDRPRSADSDSIPSLPGLEGDRREQLKRLGFPTWAVRENGYFPMLWLPKWSPRGAKLPGQIKPWRAVPDRNGRKMKYSSARGSTGLDVHPRWTRDPDPDGRSVAVLPAIQDPDVPLWITEGIKKADSLTSRDVCTVGLDGVYNWRNSHATLGDWEDVRIKGREVTVCFDADALTKTAVLDAMKRLGRWLRSKGAAKVWYVVPEVIAEGVKGVDDYFAAGGTLEALEARRQDKPYDPPATDDAFTDARLAETIAADVLDGAYCWSSALGWLGWDGKRWESVSNVAVTEAVRQYVRQRTMEALDAEKERYANGQPGDRVDLDGWRKMESAHKLTKVIELTRGRVERRPEWFDADPDLLNTPSGVVNLATGELMRHDPALLMTRITSGSYRPGFTHKDWEQALEALRPDARDWMQIRVGQAVTGHTTDSLLVLHGGGENGKGAITTDGLLPALGDYGSAASPKLFMSSKSEHSTEMADLRGQRLMIAEELTEGRSIDMTALKRVTDVGQIKARYVHKDNMTFTTSHTLFATTNNKPVINETNHGDWRRLILVSFPYTWLKPGQPVLSEMDRRGDPELKARIKANATGQHDAIVTWAVEGARRWYAGRAAQENVPDGAERPADVMSPPPSVEADTLAWRKEADRILGYWDERLIADPAAMVLTTELMDDFNDWLESNGHVKWSKETFASRFASHFATGRARVTQARVRDSGGLVRRPTPPAGAWLSKAREVPAIPRVWRGVRWRTDADQG